MMTCQGYEIFHLIFKKPNFLYEMELSSATLTVPLNVITVNSAYFP